MKKAVLALASFSLLPAVTQAVYAPIPAIEQQNPFTVSLQAGVGFDSNVVSTPDTAALPAIDSAYYQVNPTFKFNGHLFGSEQTMVGLSYSPEFFHYEDRGNNADRTLLNHRLGGSLDHAFNDNLRLRLDDQFSFIENPASALTSTGGVFLDQGYKLNVFNSRLSYDISARNALVTKYRNSIYDYTDQPFSNALDRTEHLLGLEYRYKNTAESAIVGEYRYQSINFRKAPTSDNNSSFFLVGYDHDVNTKLSYQSRAGIELRDHKTYGNSSSPYAELSSVYEYSAGSALSGGVYARTQETSNVGSHLNQDSIGAFINLTHAFSGTVTGSAHVSYDSATLEDNALADFDEETLRAGAAVTWGFAERWEAILSYDYDDVTSDVAVREYDRHRVLLSTRYTFGFGR